MRLEKMNTPSCTRHPPVTAYFDAYWHSEYRMGREMGLSLAKDNVTVKFVATDGDALICIDPKYLDWQNIDLTLKPDSWQYSPVHDNMKISLCTVFNYGKNAV